MNFLLMMMFDHATGMVKDFPFCELRIRVGGGECREFSRLRDLLRHFLSFEPGSLHGVDPNIDDLIETDPETLIFT